MAISNEAKIKVRIDGKDAEISVKELGQNIERVMKRANEQVKKTQSLFNKLGDMSQKFFYAYNSVKTITNGINQFIQASNKQEESVAALNQVMRSMGRYTDEAFVNIQKLASQIQGQGIIGDEELLRGTKFLMTYKGITDDVMPQAMRVMADFAALTGGDVASAANILGKASMGLTGAMARYGITLSDTAKKSKDFALILKEIEEQVGGQNKALADTSAGSLKQFSNTWGDLKEVIGDLLKMAIVPLTKMIRPIVEFLTGVNQKVLALVATGGLVAVTLTKIIPLMRTFGITSKFALGWIGLIIAAAELLYTAWVMNFGGIQEKTKAFWEFIKNFAKNIGSTFSNIGRLLKGAFTFNWDEIKAGWTGILDNIKSSWNTAFEDIGKETKKVLNAHWSQVAEDAQNAGNAIGAAFKKGFDLGLVGQMSTGGRQTAALEKRKGTGGFIDTIYPTPTEVKTKFEELKEILKTNFEDVGLTVDNIAGSIMNAFDTISNSIVSAMFGARIKLKDVFKSIAQDFMKLFIDEVLKMVAQVLVTKLLKLLALFDVKQNDMMAMRIGADYAKFFTQGALSVFGQNQILGALAGGGGFSDRRIVSSLHNIDRRLQQQQNTINVLIDSDSMYNSMKSSRRKEQIRRGNDINTSYF